MRWSSIVVAMIAGFSVTASAQTSLTIYNDGRVLERRIVAKGLPAGSSTHRLVLGQLDLGSLFALDSGVVVTGASYDATVDEANTLRRAIGRKLTFTHRMANGATDSTVAEVVGVDPERYRLSDGRIVFGRPGLPLYPPELIQEQPTVLMAVKADKARPNLGIGFFSSGAAWSASYALVLGAKGMARIAGQATIGGMPKLVEDAEIQLLAGNVGRVAKAQFGDAIMVRAAAPMAQEAASQQQVGEAHLYTLPGRLTLAPGVETLAALFEPANAPFERTFTVRGQLPYWGGLPQYGDETVEPVNVTYVIKRALKTEFGDRPIPAGIARVYERDAQGRPQLVGESALDHTAPGQDLRLDAGTAFDLTAKRIQSTYVTRREGRRTIATATYVVTLANAKDSLVTVDVLEQRGGEWSVVSSSVPADKVSSTITRFRVKVPAKDDATLTYQVRVVW